MSDSAKHTLEDEEAIISYFISEKGNMLVVSISGEISFKSTLTMAKIIEEVEASTAHFVIIAVEGVSRFDNKGLKRFVQLQAGIRERGCKVRVCLSDHLIKTRLIEDGALRVSEVSPKIKDAIIDLIKSKRRK